MPDLGFYRDDKNTDNPTRKEREFEFVVSCCAITIADRLLLENICTIRWYGWTHNERHSSPGLPMHKFHKRNSILHKNVHNINFLEMVLTLESLILLVKVDVLYKLVK